MKLKTLSLLTALSLSVLSGEARALQIRGTMSQDVRAHTMSYEIETDDPTLKYVIQGTTVSLPQFSMTRDSTLDFSGVVAQKEDRMNGSYTVERLANEGHLRLLFTDRVVQNVELMGIPMSGNFVTGVLGDMEFTGLNVDGASSSGGLYYNNFSGEDFSRRGTRFGRYLVTGLPGHPVFDWDNYLGQDLVHTNMIFGALKVTGTIQYSQMGNTVKIGHITLDVTDRAGSDIELSRANAPVSAKEQNLRALLGFIQLFGYDMASE